MRGEGRVTDDLQFSIIHLRCLKHSHTKRRKATVTNSNHINYGFVSLLCDLLNLGPLSKVFITMVTTKLVTQDRMPLSLFPSRFLIALSERCLPSNFTFKATSKLWRNPNKNQVNKTGYIVLAQFVFTVAVVAATSSLKLGFKINQRFGF